MRIFFYRVISGLVGLFLIGTIVYLLLIDTPVDTFNFFTLFGGFVLGVVFIVYSLKGLSLVDKNKTLSK